MIDVDSLPDATGIAYDSTDNENINRQLEEKLEIQLLSGNISQDDFERSCMIIDIHRSPLHDLSFDQVDAHRRSDLLNMSDDKRKVKVSV